MPGPPARPRRPRHLPVRQPGDGLVVIAAEQGSRLGAVHRHLLEVLQPSGMVEVNVGSDGQQRPRPGPLRRRQQPGVAQVVGQAAQPQSRVDHHVSLRAPHQPDVRPVTRLVEALLDPEDPVTQGLVREPLQRRHGPGATSRTQGTLSAAAAGGAAPGPAHCGSCGWVSERGALRGGEGGPVREPRGLSSVVRVGRG